MECLLKASSSMQISFGASTRPLDLTCGFGFFLYRVQGVGSMIWVKGALAVLQLKKINQQQNMQDLYMIQGGFCVQYAGIHAHIK